MLDFLLQVLVSLLPPAACILGLTLHASRPQTLHPIRLLRSRGEKMLLCVGSDLPSQALGRPLLTKIGYP